MTDGEHPQHNGRRDRLRLALILSATFLCYVKTLWNDFTYDDRVFAAAYTAQGPNPMVVGDRPLADYLVTPMGAGVLERSRGYRPVTVLSYAWTHKLVRKRIDPPRRHPGYAEAEILQAWTDPPWPHHLLNVLLHVLATWLAYLIVHSLTGPGTPPLLAAAVFGLHALRSDPVCSVVGRGELLAFVLGASGLLLYLRALSRAAGARWRLALGAGCCLLLALHSKESALAWVVFVPLFATTLDTGRGSRWSESLRSQLAPGALAVVAPAALFALLHARFLRIAVTEPFEVSFVYNQIYHLGFLDRLPTAVMVLGYGLFKTAAPFSLSCDYGWRVFDTVGWGDPRFLAAALVLAALLAIGLRCFRCCPALFLGVAVFLGFAFVTSNVPVPIETIFGERLLYTPALGLSLIVAALASRWTRTVTLAAVVWLAGSAAMCVQRSFDWRDNETLFSADSAKRPRSTSLQINMARLARLQVPPDWALRERYLRRVLAVDPRSFAAKNELAADLLDHGRLAEAEELLSSALRDVEAVEAVHARDFEMRDQGVTILLNLAVATLRAGKIAEARQHFGRAIRAGAANPTNNRARRAWRGAFWLAWRQRDAAAAARIASEASRLFPRDPHLAMHPGLMLWSDHRYAAAAESLEQGLAAISHSDLTLTAWEALVDCLLRTGRRAKAAAALGEHATILFHLEAFARADELLDQALSLAPSSPALRKLHLWSAWERGDVDEVRGRLLAARAAAPRDPELAVHDGLLAAHDGDWRRAADVLGPRLRRYPTTRERLTAWLTLAEASVRTGDRANARHVIQEICRRYRSMPRRYADALLELRRRLDRDR